MIVVPALVHIFEVDEAEARATCIFTILPMVIVSGFFYYNNNFSKQSFTGYVLCIRNCSKTSVHLNLMTTPHSGHPVLQLRKLWHGKGKELNKGHRAVRVRQKI